MNQRQFGNTGIMTSGVGLGCWQLGHGWGDISEASALAILEAALDNGITFFDTSDVYGAGRSETLIRQAMEKRGAHPYIATKLGRHSEPGWPEPFTEPALRLATEGSLRRLGRETLDLTQLHCIPTEVMRQGDVFEWLRTLKAEGKIRDFGASVESMEEALICLEQPGLASLQIIFNILRQKPITALFDAAKQRGEALIIRLPLDSGLLSGKMTRETKFAENDHRNFNKDGQAFNVGETFGGLPYELGVDLADELKLMVPEGMTLAQMALRWILDFDAVSVVIPGASSAAQAAANASASDLPPLSPELHKRLAEFYDTRAAAHIRGKY